MGEYKIPYTLSNPPTRIRALPKHAKEIFISAYNAAHKQYKGNEQKANGTAWAAVKTKYKQTKEGRWVAKSILARIVTKILTNEQPVTGPFNLYFSMKKSFNFKMEELAKDIKIGDKIPLQFADLDLQQGIYSYGIASIPTKDTEGDRVLISDEILNGLTKPPYNKIFLSHKNEDIASGTIKFAGRMPNTEEAIILERINEAHPMFQNIVGSIQNGSLDSYSVAGNASLEYDPTDGSKIRRVQELREVSRTSYPAHPGAAIQGMFMVKMKDGAYSYDKKEENTMDEELKKILEEIQKRLETLESFKKDLEEAKGDDEPDKDVGAEEAESEETETEETEKTADEEEEKEEEGSEELEKLRKSNEKLEKSLEEIKKTLKEKKSIVKDETKELKKTAPESDFWGFIKDDNRRSLY